MDFTKEEYEFLVKIGQIVKDETSVLSDPTPTPPQEMKAEEN